MSTSSNNRQEDVKTRWERQESERQWAGKMVGKSMGKLHIKDVLHVEDG